MKNALLYAPLFALVFALMGSPAAMAELPDDLLADGLANKVSATIAVWDAAAGMFVNQRVNVAESAGVTSNNSGDILFDFVTDPSGGDFLMLQGTMLISDKAVINFGAGGLPLKGRRIMGNGFATGGIVVSGAATIDGNGVVSGAGTVLWFEGATIVKAVGRDNSAGNVAGTVNMAVFPADPVLANYTGTGGLASSVPTSAKVKMTPIKFESHSAIPNPFTLISTIP